MQNLFGVRRHLTRWDHSNFFIPRGKKTRVGQCDNKNFIENLQGSIFELLINYCIIFIQS